MVMASNRVALVTGASSGIGRAAAELLAANGFTVYGTSRTPDQSARAYTLLPLDVRSGASVEAAVQSLLEQAGRIDVLVNNAGYAQVGAIEENGVADVQAQLDTNVLGAVRVIKAVLPAMRRQGSGRIINVGSVVGQVAVPYLGVYSASKFALEGLTEALREEVRQFGVEVSLIEPTFAKTSLVSQRPPDPIAAYAPARQAALQFAGARIAGGIEPGAVARVILRTATATRPRLRYLVGRDAQALMLFKRLLPEPLFERLRRRVFRSGGRAALQPRAQSPA
jgi:NAD(P)-dependent dehydrogenase (short-subunit alcohol dehydrogenase family)